jgi:hypothetical protein
MLQRIGAPTLANSIWDTGLVVIYAALLSFLATVSADEPVPPRDAGTVKAPELVPQAPTYAQPSRILLGKEFRSVRLVGNDQLFQEVRAVLLSGYDLDWESCSLRDIASDVADKTSIQVRVDYRALEDIGFDIDSMPITSNLSDMQLNSGLRKCLEDLDLSYVADDEGILITSKDVADSVFEPRFYPLTTTTDASLLINALYNCFAPPTWSVVGGAGAIDLISGDMGRGLVITQTQQVHEEILGFFMNLDRAAWQPLAGGEEPGSFVRVYRIADKRLQKDLHATLLIMCQASLGADYDATATITVVGDSLVIQSRSRATQVMAGELLGAITGTATPPAIQPLGTSGGIF